MLPWQPILNRQFFKEIENPFSLVKKNYFCYCTFGVFSSYSVLLLILITFCLISSLSTWQVNAFSLFKMGPKLVCMFSAF